MREGEDSLVIRFIETREPLPKPIVGTRYPMEGSYSGPGIRTGQPVYVEHVRPGGQNPSNIS